MVTTKPHSPQSMGATDAAAATAPMIDEGMQMLKTQLASTGVIPQKVWEMQLSVMSEMLSFISRRAQAQAELCQRLGRCTEIAEAVDVQQDFSKGVGADYAEEAERLSDLTRRGLDAWTGVGAKVVSGINGHPRKAA